MKVHLPTRAVSAILLGSMFGWYVHHDSVRWNQLGRVAFLAYQTQRFDRYLVSPTPAAFTILFAAVMTVGFFALYELVSFALSKVFSSAERGNSNS
jgi:predicted small integral membrane protein